MFVVIAQIVKVSCSIYFFQQYTKYKTSCRWQITQNFHPPATFSHLCSPKQTIRFPNDIYNRLCRTGLCKEEETKAFSLFSNEVVSAPVPVLEAPVDSSPGLKGLRLRLRLLPAIPDCEFPPRVVLGASLLLVVVYAEVTLESRGFTPSPKCRGLTPSALITSSRSSLAEPKEAGTLPK